MKLSIGLNTKSIKDATKALEMVKKQLEEQMLNELLKACVEWIKNRANARLEALDIGVNVINGIKSAWEISEVQGGKIILTNKWHKPNGKYEMASAFVEFGTGLGGIEDPHEMASKVNYDYNVQPGSKDEDGTWYFFTSKENLDLPSRHYRAEKRFKAGGRLLVSTQGTGATRFLYNAVMDFESEDVASTLWQEIKTKYWG